MITAITVAEPRGKPQVFDNPTLEDLEWLMSVILQYWVGQFEMESHDGWSLTLFGEPGKYAIGIVKFDTLGFFAKNPDISESGDTRIGVAWNDARQDEVLTQDILVRKCLLGFFETARPTPELEWRKVEIN